MQITPLGIDVHGFPEQPVARPIGPVHLGSISYLTKRKNPLFLVEVMRELRDTHGLDADLTIGGSGPLAPILRDRIDSEGLAGKVRMAGHVPVTEVAHMMQGFHMFLLPSQKESFGYVLLEAKLSGAWTVVTEGMDVPSEFCDFAVPLIATEWARTIAGMAREASVRGSWTVPDVSGLRTFYSSDRYACRLLRAAGVRSDGVSGEEA
jgi:glycosyltransferase involved in cell wall biosynthesis